MPSQTQHPRKTGPMRKQRETFSSDESHTESLDSEEEAGASSGMDEQELSEEIAAARNPQVDNWVFPSVDPEKGKRNDYTEALKKAQIKIGELQVTIRKLHIRNVELATYVMRFKKQKKALNSKTSQLSNKDKRVAQLGRRFGIMNEPFVPPAAFLTERPPNFSTDSGRYESETSQLNGIIAELFEETPKDLHGDLKGSPDFRKTFLHGLHSCRRSMIHQLRSTTASQIFGFPQSYYHVDYDRKNLQEFQNLLKFPGETRYSKFAPLLFPDNRKNMKYIFRSSNLAKMLKTVLFGPSSLNSKKKPSGRTQGRMWGLSVVTPGAIALMAVWAIFLHSPDREFASVGAASGIPYERWYMYFKSFLMNSAGKEHIQKLFAWWNGWVFSFTESKHPRMEDEGSSGMEEAELFEASTSSEEELDNRGHWNKQAESDKATATVVSQLGTLQVSGPSPSSIEPELYRSPSLDSLQSRGTNNQPSLPPPFDCQDNIGVSIESMPAPEDATGIQREGATIIQGEGATSMQEEENLQIVPLVEETPKVPGKVTKSGKQQTAPKGIKGRKKKGKAQVECSPELVDEIGQAGEVHTDT